MNLSYMYLDWHISAVQAIRIFHGSPLPFASPQPSPRAVTCQQVQDRLKDPSDLKQLEALQTSQQKVKATGGDDTTLKAF